MLHSSIPVNQGWIIERMEALKYPFNPEGVCFGIANMAVQAILANDLATYNARLELINSIPKEELGNAIDEVYKKSSSLSKLAKSKGVNVESLLSERERLLISIPPFFTGVSLYQMPEASPEFFEKNKKPTFQDENVSEPLTRPTQLDKITKIDTFTSAHDLSTLEKYFSILRDDLKNNNVPFALTLSCINHSIAIGYDNVKDMWTLTDANKLPTKYISDLHELAVAVNTSLSGNPFTVFSTRIFSEEKNSKEIDEILTTWIFQQMNDVSSETAKIIDAQGISWLTFAVIQRDSLLISELLSSGANPHFEHRKHKDKIKSPFMYAYDRNDTEILKLLLPYVDNKFDSQNLGDTRLTLAIKLKLPEMVDKLINDGMAAYINKPDKDGLTPLKLAIQSGEIKLVQSLLNVPGINIDQTNSYGFTLLAMEIIKNNDPIIKLLIEHGAKIDFANSKGLTPLHLAISKKNIDCVNLMLKGIGLNPNSEDASGKKLIDQVMQMNTDEVSNFIANSKPLKITNAHQIENLINENEISRIKKIPGSENKILVWNAFIEMVKQPKNINKPIIDIYQQWKDTQTILGISNIDIIQPGTHTTSVFFKHAKDDSYLFLNDILLAQYADKKPGSFPVMSSQEMQKLFEAAFIEKLAKIFSVNTAQLKSLPLPKLIRVYEMNNLDKVKESVSETLKEFRNCDPNVLKSSLNSSPLIKYVNELIPSNKIEVGFHK